MNSSTFSNSRSSEGKLDCGKTAQLSETGSRIDRLTPADLKKAVEGYRAAWRTKMEEVGGRADALSTPRCCPPM